ncbi:MAG: WD40 repeat domain-containing protein, partial [Anaerolineae bacterium]|nr:WD40 repeat domain-containing protein [Anaerolineae bacterium]
TQIPDTLQAQSAALNNGRFTISPESIDQFNLINQWQLNGIGAAVHFTPDTQMLLASYAGESESNILFYAINGYEIEPAAFNLNMPQSDFSRNWNALQFINNGDNLAASYSDGFFVWDLKTGDLTGRVLQGYTSGIAAYGNSHLWSYSHEARLAAWWKVNTKLPEPTTSDEGADNWELDPLISQLIMALRLHEAIVDMAILQDQIYLLGSSGLFYRFEDVFAEPEALPQTVQPERPEPIGGSSLITIPANTQWVAYAGSYRDVVLYDIEHNNQIARYALDTPIGCLKASPDGRILLIVERSFEPNIIVLDAASVLYTGSLQEIARIPTDIPIGFCNLSPDGTLFATSDIEGNISLWGIQDQ